MSYLEYPENGKHPSLQHIDSYDDDKSIDNQIIFLCDDALSCMSKLAENSFDLAICDPPYGAASKNKWEYAASKNLKGFGGEWKLNTQIWDLLSQNDNFTFTYIWINELKRLVKRTGSIWIHSTYHNSGFVNICCQLLGLEIINEVVWYKRNAFPNLSARRLTASHETLLWVHTGGKDRKYYFNYDEAKKISCPEDNLKETGKQLRTVWDIPNNKTAEEIAFGKHPTQKPLRLTERILKISGQKGGNLLIPFAGSGTEIIAGLKHDMKVVAFEINNEYYELANRRINAYLESEKETLFNDK